MYNFRTDLADERADIFKKNNGITNSIDGIETNIKEDGNNAKSQVTERPDAALQLAAAIGSSG